MQQTVCMTLAEQLTIENLAYDLAQVLYFARAQIAIELVDLLLTSN